MSAKADQSAEAARIDETLTRLTAAHAGLLRDEDDEAAEAAPQRRPRLTPLRLACLVLAAVVFSATAVGFASRSWLDAGVTQVAALDPDSGAVVDAAAQAGDSNVLVVAGEIEAVPGVSPTGATSGTVTVAHIPAGGGQLTVLSIPLDLEINRPPCDRYDPVSRTYTTPPVQAEVRTQLASTLAVGGPRCMTRVVQQLTGLAITGYVGVDLDGLGTVVGTLGGVPVCVPRPVVDGTLGPLLPEAGTQTVDGAKAADFLRAADVDGDPRSGRARIERQQGVLAAALAPLLSTTGLLNVSRLAAVRPELGDALVVDGLELDQVYATAHSLSRLDADGVTFVPTPVTPEPNGRGNETLRDADAAAVFTAVRTDAALPPDATSDAALTGPAPGDLRIQVTNATGRSGLAGTVGDTLTQLGFTIGGTDNAPQPSAQTIIRYSPDQEAAARLLAATVPVATTVPDPGSTTVLQLVLGRSFDDVLKPPVDRAAQTDLSDDTGPVARCS